MPIRGDDRSTELIWNRFNRNILAYGIRFSMYGGMAVMMSVIWIRLGYEATTINDRLSVHFYGVSHDFHRVKRYIRADVLLVCPSQVAFLSFMSVAGIPACEVRVRIGIQYLC